MHWSPWNRASPEDAILPFYRQAGTDHRGRSLHQIRGQTLDELESVHDYIQWLFPLPEASRFNSSAPLLTEADIAAFHADERLRTELLESLRTMLRFYGFTLSIESGSPVIRRSGMYEERKLVWVEPQNHNHLRLSRILRSLRLLGLADHARALLRALEHVAAEESSAIYPRTLSYWRGAAGGT